MANGSKGGGSRGGGGTGKIGGSRSEPHRPSTPSRGGGLDGVTPSFFSSHDQALHTVATSSNPRSFRRQSSTALSIRSSSASTARSPSRWRSRSRAARGSASARSTASASPASPDRAAVGGRNPWARWYIAVAAEDTHEHRKLFWQGARNIIE